MTMKKNAGFTLVELMIAVAISMVAMLAATEAYVSSKQTSRLQAMQNRLTEDGRFAVSMIQRVIGQAGFRPSPLVALPSDRISIASNVVTLKFTADGLNQIICDGSIPAVDSVNSLVIDVNSNSLRCISNGVGAGDLWVRPSNAGSGIGTEVADFRVLLGIDTGPTTPSNYGCGQDTGTRPRDCIVDKYAAALSGGENAEQIVAVKVCIVLRTQSTDGSIAKASNMKDCSGADIANSANDKKLYRTYWTTVLLKNR